MRKGDTVFYVTNAGKGEIIKGKVRTKHRDGRLTIQAFCVYEDGKAVGPFLGFGYEIAADAAHPNAMEADIYRSVARALAREAA